MSSHNKITILLGVLVVGLIIMIGSSIPDIQLFKLEPRPIPLSQVTPIPTSQDLNILAVTFEPISEISTTPVPVPVPKEQYPVVVSDPTIDAGTDRGFSFSDPVPAADSPELEAGQVLMCFSQYSRNQNQTKNKCLGEWYPVNKTPREHDKYWCAYNNGNIEWVPVRFYDGRGGGEIVIPSGNPERCG